MQSDLDSTMEETSKAWGMFLAEFDNSVVTGDYQKFGKTSTTKKHELIPGDFVLVIYETQNVRRYGIITKVNSLHTVSVKVLHKRSVGKDGQNYVPKIEQFSTQQVKLIYRVPKGKQAWIPHIFSLQGKSIVVLEPSAPNILCDQIFKQYLIWQYESIFV